VQKWKNCSADAVQEKKAKTKTRQKIVLGREKKLKGCLWVTFKLLKMPVTILYSNPSLGAMIFVSYFCYERKILIHARNELNS